MTKTQTVLTVEDLTTAEMEIIKFCQGETFQEEICLLKKGIGVKKTSHLRKLDPIIENGVLRVEGRLSAAAMAEHVKHQLSSQRTCMSHVDFSRYS